MGSSSSSRLLRLERFGADGAAGRTCPRRADFDVPARALRARQRAAPADLRAPGLSERTSLSSQKGPDLLSGPRCAGLILCLPAVHTKSALRGQARPPIGLEMRALVERALARSGVAATCERARARSTTAGFCKRTRRRARTRGAACVAPSRPGNAAGRPKPPRGSGVKCVPQAGGAQRSFSPGRSSQRHSAGRKISAANMLTTNMKVSIRPMSAWNLSSEKIHIATPTASVSAV
jgi:hypothetical protein